VQAGVRAKGGTVRREHRAPYPGQAVRVSGTGGGDATATDRDGFYDFIVKRGKHTITLPGGSKKLNPKSRTVDAQSDTDHLNFTDCDRTDPKRCDLVEIDGTLVDVDGQPFANALITVNDHAQSVPQSIGDISDTAVTDSLGRFTVLAPRGDVYVRASASNTIDKAPRFASTAKGIHISGDEDHVTMKLQMTPRLFGYSKSSATKGLKGDPEYGVLFFVASALSLAGSTSADRIYIQHEGANAPGCVNVQVVPIAALIGHNSFSSATPSQDLLPVPSPAPTEYCPGTYEAILEQSNGKHITRSQFTLAGKLPAAPTVTETTTSI
jgi:hypothetical protein